MIAIVILWLACGFLAAGWISADLAHSGVEELLSVASYRRINIKFAIIAILLGPISAAFAIIERIKYGVAFGWRCPFTKPGTIVEDHWFKRR